ncbi:citrate lyase subunit alpha [Escherichia coli]
MAHSAYPRAELPASAKNKAIEINAESERYRRQTVAAWNRRAECDLAASRTHQSKPTRLKKHAKCKLCANLEEAIRRSGLQDGMTVSFHHAFRGGDLTVNMVMDVISEDGL